MKIWTRNGEVTVPPAQLANYDKHARRKLAKAKRAKAIKVEDNLVRFKFSLRGQVPHEMQSLLRDLANIREHGKAYASDAPNEQFLQVHSRISNSREFLVPVMFNLDTGEMTVDWASGLKEQESV